MRINSELLKKVSEFNIVICCFKVHGTGALVISAMLDFLTFALCAPYSETTDGGHFDSLLETVAANGRIIFKLFQVRTKFNPCTLNALNFNPYMRNGLAYRYHLGESTFNFTF